MASNISLLTLTVLGLVLNFSSMIDLVGSLGILAGTIFIVVTLVIGTLLGGSESGVRNVMGLGTAQRNISAALVVAAQNFDADVITYLRSSLSSASLFSCPRPGNWENGCRRIWVRKKPRNQPESNSLSL